MSSQASKDAFEQMADLMQKVEPLCEELQPYLRHYGKFKGINHPLVQEIPLFDESRCALVNRRLLHKQEQIAKAIDNRDWDRFIMLHERPYRFGAMQELMRNNQLSDTELARLVGDVWTDSENIWQHQDAWLAVWRTLKQPHLTMDDAERQAWQHFGRLKGPLVIYRGINQPNHNPNGMSWSLDRDKALWFAKRLSPRGPRLLRGQVMPDAVFAYFVGRGENEVVVDPTKVLHISSTRVYD